MWRSTKVHVSPGFFAMLVFSLLCGAGEVLPHVLIAALCHELGHLAVLRLYRVPVEAITVTSMGAVIAAPGQERLSYGQELLAALAGVLVNFTLALLFARLSRDYLFAGANVILGVYNLLPLQGLDGGRALYLMAAWLREPFAAARLVRLVNLVAMALLIGLSMMLLYRTGSGLFCLIAVLGMGFSQIIGQLKKRRGRKENGVAKRGKIRYNT